MVTLSAARPRPPGPPQALLWDYDGTLVDTRASDEAAIAALVSAEPGAAEGVARFWSTDGRPLAERLEDAWPGRTTELLARFDAGVPRLHRGVEQVVRALHRRGIRQGVVSSRRREPLLLGLGASGLGRWLEVVVSLDCVTACKPDPEGIERALRILGAAPAAAVYVGDRDLDLEAAAAAGVTGWRASWGDQCDPARGSARGLATPGDVLGRLDALSAAAGP